MFIEIIKNWMINADKIDDITVVTKTVTPLGKMKSVPYEQYHIKFILKTGETYKYHNHDYCYLSTAETDFQKIKEMLNKE